MTALSEWRSAFPRRSAENAVEALLDAWQRLASNPRLGFNTRTHEPNLTKELKIHLESYVAREHGLLGMWAAEDVIGKIDPKTGRVVERRRTDIAYGWNDESQQLKLVFEFKRLGNRKQHRDEYLGEDGLGRFVTGIYGRGQPFAAMVGILLAPKDEVIPPIQAALADDDLAATLRLRDNDLGKPYKEPSKLFKKAHFDTEHDRPPDLAPPDGYIQVAHFFVGFGETASS